MARLKQLRIVWFALVFSACWALAPFAPPASANADQELLRAVQKRYDQVRSFKAQFTQRAYVKIMDQTQESKGDVSIKKPGRMKWSYAAPDPHVLICNERTLWLYVPEEKQVTKASIKDVYTTNTPALFLSGKGRLAETFRLAQVKHDGESSEMTLTPVEKEQGLERLVLLVNNKSYQIVGSKVYDKLGNFTEILFTHIEVNVDLPEDMFDFKTPPGVELLDTAAKE